MPNHPAPSSYDSAHVTESNLVQSWRATLVVDTEPLIVARLIQRLACQGRY